MEQHWYVDIIRALFGMLDGIIYGLISTVYDLIEEIAHFKIFDDAALNSFSSRIYAILSIFMLFKVSFSFINYLINPDSFTDKEKGVQNIIKNIIVMFIMLVMCPWFFEKLWGLQATILDENVLGKFVFAETSENSLTATEFKYNPACTTTSTAETNGDYLAIMTLRGFYQFYTVDEFRNIGIEELDKYESDYPDMLKIACEANSTDDLLVSSLYNGDTASDTWNMPWSEDYYLINYDWGISTAVGVVVLLILVGFAMDVGLRVVKLSFLEIIAPIPIVTYIDPASGKNGMFKKWLKEVGSTWASVFIRLIALFFAVSVIQKVGELQFIGDLNKHEAGFWVQLFVIIGALMFAKQLPKLLQNITGINFDGGFNINPLKKAREQAIGGNLIAGAATGTVAGSLAFAGGMAANTWNFGKNLNKNVKDLGLKAGFQRTYLGTNEDGTTRTFKNGKTGVRGAFAGAHSMGRIFNNSVGSILAGGVSSGTRAVVRGKDGKWQPIKNATVGIETSSEKRNQREKGVGLKEQVKRKVTATAGIKDEYGLYGKNDARIKELKNIEAELNAQEEFARQAQIEYMSSTPYSVESFREGFRRNPEGMGERLFDGYAGVTDFDKYMNYITDINRKRVAKHLNIIPVIADRMTFDTYNKRENDAHYLNVEHEKVKKELSQAEKLFADKNKKG